jgi:hypothetical protein
LLPELVRGLRARGRQFPPSLFSPRAFVWLVHEPKLAGRIVPDRHTGLHRRRRRHACACACL